MNWSKGLIRVVLNILAIPFLICLIPFAIFLMLIAYLWVGPQDKLPGEA